MITIWKSLKLFLLMTLVTGVFYPLFMTIIAQMIANKKANGSILYQQEKAVGSSLIAQKFSRANYFWPRPSAHNYDPLNSGGSNLSPTSRKLQETVRERQAFLAKVHNVPEEIVPREMLFASGSGLDPHISIAAAYFQLDRVLKARGLSTPSDRKRIDKLIEQLAQHQSGTTSYINVLLLNKALDEDKK